MKYKKYGVRGMIKKHAQLKKKKGKRMKLCLIEYLPNEGTECINIYHICAQQDLCI